MLCAQLGNAQSYYGNIQLSFSQPYPVKYGAWQRKPEPRIYEEEHVSEPPTLPDVIVEDTYDYATRNRLLAKTAKKQIISKDDSYKKLQKAKIALEQEIENHNRAFLLFM